MQVQAIALVYEKKDIILYKQHRSIILHRIEPHRIAVFVSRDLSPPASRSTGHGRRAVGTRRELLGCQGLVSEPRRRGRAVVTAIAGAVDAIAGVRSIGERDRVLDEDSERIHIHRKRLGALIQSKRHHQTLRLRGLCKEQHGQIYRFDAVDSAEFVQHGRALGAG